MKVTGYLLLIAGFLCGAYATALDTQAIEWTLFVPAAVAALAGVVLLKRHERGAARSDHVLTANRIELTESLDNIVAALAGIVKETGEAPLAERRLAIDSRLREDLRRFADARASLVHLFGMQTYADIMSEFAAGERFVNRVWSASADGYRDEADAYLHKASAKFAEAKRQLGSAVSGL